MELVLSVLLVSSLTSVGLLALWAATSNQHWFLRTAVFLGLLSLLLLIPAYEPFVVFTWQGVIVASGIHCARWWRHAGKTSSRRFSLATMLQAVVVVALLAAVGSRLPELNFLAWRSVVMVGFCAGVATLVGYWVAAAEKPRWWWRLLFGGLCAVLISLPLVVGDWFVLSVASAGLLPWPPEPSAGSVSGVFGGPQDDDLTFPWIAIVFMETLLIYTLLWLGLLVARGASSEHSRPNQFVRRSFLVVCCVLLVLPSLLVYYQLMTPLPIPKQHLPSDNGFHDLVEAGRIAEDWHFNTTQYYPEAAPIAELRTAVAAMQPAYDKLQVGLAKEIRMPIDYHSPEGFGLESISELRSIARCTAGKALLAARENRTDDAVADYLNTVELGYSIRKDTLMIDALVGSAISGFGQCGLYEMRDQLSATQCQRIITALQMHEQQCQPAEQFVYRDRVWSQHATGWHGHLVQLLSDVSEPDFWYSTDAFLSAAADEQAKSRLLQVELALLAYRSKQGHLPDSLDELLTEFIDRVPIDPHNAQGATLLYRLVQDSYVLYSVGRDGEDDGGIPPENIIEPMYWHSQDGDLRLELLYAQEETAPTDESGLLEPADEPGNE